MALIGIEVITIPFVFFYAFPYIKDRLQRWTSRRPLPTALDGLAKLKDNDMGTYPCDDEEEIIVAGRWVPDLTRIEYYNEPILRVREVVEGEGCDCTARDGIMISSHRYVICESATWAYVFEKWRDGVSVLRFRLADKALYHRGRYFESQNHAARKNPRLVQEVPPPSFPLGLDTDALLLWTASNATFSKYSDNCHTFAANMSEACGGRGSNLFERWMYDAY